IWLTGNNYERVFNACKEILSIIPTPLGNYMRRAFYWATCTSVSWDTNFIFGSWLAHRNNKIAQRVTIGAYTFIGYADIGENVLFGARVSIISGKYQHGRPDQRVNQKEIENKSEIIKIGRNSWIGQDVVIMANIGENCTVGAGSVVMKDVPDNATVLGNPARKVNLK
ncbi:MAG: acyltransferase, partial [candidate division Zixibacteria bacterium]|nr:acyltransferase [candidate division Zixibacteria bacterium]